MNAAPPLHRLGLDEARGGEESVSAWPEELGGLSDALVDVLQNMAGMLGKRRSIYIDRIANRDQEKFLLRMLRMPTPGHLDTRNGHYEAHVRVRIAWGGTEASSLAQLMWTRLMNEQILQHANAPAAVRDTEMLYLEARPPVYSEEVQSLYLVLSAPVQTRWLQRLGSVAADVQSIAIDFLGAYRVIRTFYPLRREEEEDAPDLPRPDRSDDAGIERYNYERRDGLGPTWTVELTFLGDKTLAALNATDSDARRAVQYDRAVETR